MVWSSIFWLLILIGAGSSELGALSSGSIAIGDRNAKQNSLVPLQLNRTLGAPSYASANCITDSEKTHCHMKLAMLLASLLFMATNVEAHPGYKDKPVGADDPHPMPGPDDPDHNHVHPKEDAPMPPPSPPPPSPSAPMPPPSPPPPASAPMSPPAPPSPMKEDMNKGN